MRQGMRQKQTIPDKESLALAAAIPLQIFFQRGCLSVQGTVRPPVVCNLLEKRRAFPFSFEEGPPFSLTASNPGSR